MVAWRKPIKMPKDKINKRGKRKRKRGRTTWPRSGHIQPRSPSHRGESRLRDRMNKDDSKSSLQKGGDLVNKRPRSGASQRHFED